MADPVRPPAPLGPYRAVARAGDWIICSGQLGLLDGALVAGGVGAETTRAIANLKDLLESEGVGLAEVMKTTVFLADIADFDEMNEAYAKAFAGHRPARSAIGVAGLPRGARVEIEAWAHQGASRPPR